MNKFKYSTLVGLVLVITQLLAACQSTFPLVTATVPGVSAGITNDVCPNLIISLGEQVIWTNQDTREHIIRHKPSNGNSQFDSGLLQPGDSFAFSFSQTGNYTYECSTNESVMGTVLVQP